MGVEGLPSIDGFIASLRGDPAAGERPTEGSAGAVAALTVALAADLAAQVARRSPAWPERDDALRRAAEISAHITAVAGDVDRTFERALAGLARATAARGVARPVSTPSAPPGPLTTPGEARPPGGDDLGDALIDILALLLSIGEAAEDAAALAERTAAAGSVTLRATAVAATMLAVGAAEMAAHLVEINLLVSPGDPLASRAREHLDAACASRDAAIALPR
jgi:formiminotetrahydrofolate cyclodeaminase